MIAVLDRKKLVSSFGGGDNPELNGVGLVEIYKIFATQDDFSRGNAD